MIFVYLTIFQIFCLHRFYFRQIRFQRIFDSEISRNIVYLFQFLILFIWILGFSRFVPPQTSSGNRFMPQQNSPVPSPYAPQSPAGYMPYSHPSSYTTHPQMQQGKKVGCLFIGNTCYSKQIHVFLFIIFKTQTKILYCILICQ